MLKPWCDARSGITQCGNTCTTFQNRLYQTNNLKKAWNVYSTDVTLERRYPDSRRIGYRIKKIYKMFKWLLHSFYLKELSILCFKSLELYQCNHLPTFKKAGKYGSRHVQKSYRPMEEIMWIFPQTCWTPNPLILTIDPSRVYFQACISWPLVLGKSTDTSTKPSLTTIGWFLLDFLDLSIKSWIMTEIKIKTKLSLSNKDTIWLQHARDKIGIFYMCLFFHRRAYKNTFFHTEFYNRFKCHFSDPTILQWACFHYDGPSKEMCKQSITSWFERRAAFFWLQIVHIVGRMSIHLMGFSDSLKQLEET